MFKAIVYISQATIDFNKNLIKELADNAAAHNAHTEITGYLWFKKGQFVQYIEGHESDIDNLMAQITTDKRHQVLYQQTTSCNAKRFPNWSMRYISARDAHMVDLESIITNQLLMMNVAYKSKLDEKLVNSIWRVVDSISHRVINHQYLNSQPKHLS